MSRLFAELIDYYQQCLLQERRETLSILESRLEQSVISLEGWAHNSWLSLNALPRVQQFVQAQRGRGAVAIVYAPYALIGSKLGRFNTPPIPNGTKVAV